MPPSFLTAFDKQALAQLPAIVPQTDLIRYFKLSDRDLKLLSSLRGAHNRLGFAIQLCMLRYWGCCPDPVCAVPLSVLDFISEQLGIEASQTPSLWQSRSNPDDSSPSDSAVFGLCLGFGFPSHSATKLVIGSRSRAR